jgi:hypothetical protein
VREPALEVRGPASVHPLYVFTELPRYPNYFDGIRDRRDLIGNALKSIVSTAVLNEASRGGSPVIGVHVRRSDFREQASGELPGAQANVRTPSGYFIDSIRWVRQIHGDDLRVTIYTDAYPEELRDLLTLDNVVVSPSSNALCDLISLSRSRCLILSHGSTFGYWAGFLADAPVILPYPLASPIRAPETNKQYYEGVAREDALLVRNIKAIPERQSTAESAR